MNLYFKGMIWDEMRYFKFAVCDFFTLKLKNMKKKIIKKKKKTWNLKKKKSCSLERQ